jgi:serine/threonine protein kinase
MGDVFVDRDTRLHRAVAIKVLKSSLSDEGLAAARFEREARAIAGLNHPNIAPSTTSEWKRGIDSW